MGPSLVILPAQDLVVDGSLAMDAMDECGRLLYKAKVPISATQINLLRQRDVYFSAAQWRMMRTSIWAASFLAPHMLTPSLKDGLKPSAEAHASPSRGVSSGVLAGFKRYQRDTAIERVQTLLSVTQKTLLQIRQAHDQLQQKAPADQAASQAGASDALRASDLCAQAIWSAVQEDTDQYFMVLFHWFCRDYAHQAVTQSLLTSSVIALAADDLGLDVLQSIRSALLMNISILHEQTKFAALEESQITTQDRELIARHGLLSASMLQAMGEKDNALLRAIALHNIEQNRPPDLAISHSTPVASIPSLKTLHAQGSIEPGSPPTPASRAHDTVADNTEPRNPAEGSDQGARLAHLLRKTDRYIARMRPRKYRRALNALAAGRDAFLTQAGSGDEYGIALIRSTGLYPPGTAVELSNGEIALVLRRSLLINRPIVASLRTADSLLAKPVVRDTQQESFRVKKTLAPHEAPIAVNLQTLLELR